MTSFFPVPDSEIDAYLLEDVPYGDLTTAVLGIADEQGRITYRTRHATVLSSTEEAARLLTRTGCAVGLMVASGVEVPAGTTFLEAAEAGVDIIQVDKMEPARLAELVRAARAAGHPTVISAAGGVNADNAAAYAATGVDLLVTSWVYWGKPADIGVSITSEPAPKPT